METNGTDTIEWELQQFEDLYRDQTRPIKARQMHTRARHGYEDALGLRHPSTLTTVNDLGHLYADQGKLAEAEQMCTRALSQVKQGKQDLRSIRQVCLKFDPEHEDAKYNVYHSNGSIHRGRYGTSPFVPAQCISKPWRSVDRHQFLQHTIYVFSLLLEELARGGEIEVAL